jgi:holo-[acyl-carrier protein] synthase
MIIGIGIDIVYIKRMERWRKKPSILERFFHPNEIETAFSRGRQPDQSLAARFAAKEAFCKALGTGLSGIVLKDMMVINRTNGKPEMHLFGTAKTALEKSGADRVHISLTHEKDNAVAMVVLEKV